MKYLLIIILQTIVWGGCKSSATYYISNNGNNSYDGKTPATSWKTIKNIESGNTYLLKRGDTFYFNISKARGWGDKKTTIASYGNGKKPVISLYKNILATVWKSNRSNIWVADIRNANNFSGFKDTADTNVGFIKVDNKIYGNKLKNKELLRKQFDFSSDDRYLYIYSVSNPSKLSKSIRIVTNNNIIGLGDNMEVKDVWLEGTGGHAISAIPNVKNIILKNIDIIDIGGSYLSNYKTGDVRYGNGIEFWGGSNCLVENCNIRNVYDAAYTLQSTDPNAVFENITFKNNRADNNEYSFEFWTIKRGTFFKNCKFINNYCINAGMGWSHVVRPDNRTGAHIVCYYSNGVTDMTISNNTFVNAKSGYMRLPLDIPTATMFTSENNKIILQHTTPILSNDSSYNLNTLQSFIQNFGIEKNSTFKSVN